MPLFRLTGFNPISFRLKRVIIFLLLALTAFFSWYFIPGTSLDRAAFTLTSRSFATPPFLITGEGTHAQPLTLRTHTSSATHIPQKLPAVVSIGDDPEGFFQASPPSPVDFAIILSNLRRLGRDRIALATPLSWTEADAIALTALDQQLDGMASIITSSPLSRSPVPSPLPPAFRRASIPLTGVYGEISQLPIVNRVSIPDIVMGNRKSLAGFTILESEPTTARPHLLARWDDRIVLSFHLLAALSHFEVSPENIRIRLGEFVALSEQGPYIPIDSYGRLSVAAPPIPDAQAVPAPELLDAPDDFFSKTTFSPVLIRNDLSSADATTTAFSNSLVGTLVALTDPNFSSASRSFSRLPTAAELATLGALALLFGALVYHPLIKSKFGYLLIIGVILAIHFVLVPATGTWLPTLSALAVAVASMLITFLTKPPYPTPAAAQAGTPPIPRIPSKATISSIPRTPAFPQIPFILPDAASATDPAPVEAPAPGENAMTKSAAEAAQKKPTPRTPQR